MCKRTFEHWFADPWRLTDQHQRPRQRKLGAAVGKPESPARRPVVGHGDQHRKRQHADGARVDAEQQQHRAGGLGRHRVAEHPVGITLLDETRPPVVEADKREFPVQVSEKQERERKPQNQRRIGRSTIVDHGSPPEFGPQRLAPKAGDEQQHDGDCASLHPGY